MKNILSPIATYCQTLPQQQVEKPLCAVGAFHPATFDVITLYDICEMNAHIRTVNWYRQWKELKQTYKTLSQAQHAAILRDYLRSKNK